MEKMKLRRMKKIEKKGKSGASVTRLVEEFKARIISCEVSLKKILDILERQEFLLNKVENTNKIVDETASNILFAMRQNEYLQAWYPESKESKKFNVVKQEQHVS